MAQYQTLHETTHRFGTNGYLEVARKRLVEDGHQTEFLLLTRGFFGENGEKRWTRFVTIPDDEAARVWLVEALQKV